MTGKELALALVGAGLVGGGAGVAATMTMNGRPEAAASSANAEILDRLKAMEGQLAEAKKAADDSRRTLLEVQDRVTKAEIREAQSPANTGPVRPAGATKTFRMGHHGAQAGTDASASNGTIEFGGEAADGLGEAIALQLGDELGKIDIDLGDAAGQLAALQNGIKLRQLPEADRWQKAKDELGLGWNQVEDLKKAIADRDTAMKDAMTKETKTGPNGGKITIQRPDAAKAAHADAAYHDRVNATLNEQQKKDWDSKGYDNAFGSSPFGRGNVMMAIDVNSDVKGDAPKDAPK